MTTRRGLKSSSEPASLSDPAELRESKEMGASILDKAVKREALLHITYGLYVIGSRTGEELNGMTANWVTQISFEPPILAVAVYNQAKTLQMIKQEPVFTVNFLASGQKYLAEIFVEPQKRAGNKLGHVEITLGETGAPILKEALAYVECRVNALHPYGDHTLVVGEVVAAGVQKEGTPLTMEETGWHYGG